MSSRAAQKHEASVRRGREAPKPRRARALLREGRRGGEQGDLSLVLLRGHGQTAVRVVIPRWIRAVSMAAIMLSMLVSGWWGFQLRIPDGESFGMSRPSNDRVLGAMFFSLLPAPRSRGEPLDNRWSAIQERRRDLGLGTMEVAAALYAGRMRPEWVRAAGGTSWAPGTLRWPVTDGTFVRGFGAGAGAYHLAIDIHGQVGWKVRAAAPGIVAYAGNGIPGYGNIVFVVHPGGWATLYAHNHLNRVVAGEQVPFGGVVADLGSTGLSRGPHVHFEFLSDGKNCDPTALFRPGILHGTGRTAILNQVEWDDPGVRPPIVRCYTRRHHPGYDG